MRIRDFWRPVFAQKRNQSCTWVTYWACMVAVLKCSNARIHLQVVGFSWLQDTAVQMQLCSFRGESIGLLEQSEVCSWSRVESLQFVLELLSSKLSWILVFQPSSKRSLLALLGLRVTQAWWGLRCCYSWHWVPCVFLLMDWIRSRMTFGLCRILIFGLCVCFCFYSFLNCCIQWKRMVGNMKTDVKAWHCGAHSLKLCIIAWWLSQPSALL